MRDLHGRASRIAGIGLAAMLAVLAVPQGQAQVGSGDLDELQQELEEARDRVQTIQSEADTIEEQIASIDEQAAAVAEALDAATALVERTQSELVVLRHEIDRKRDKYQDLSQRAREIAVELYKEGPTGAIETVFDAGSLNDVMRRVEYTSRTQEDNLQVMTETRRLEQILAVDEAQLQKKYEEAVAAKNERIAQAQHLRELRAAQEARLADVRRQIQAEQSEADALADASADLEAELAAAAPAPQPAPVGIAPTGEGASGFAWPLSGAVTSGFGYRWGRMHTGLDIDCVTGAAIHASKAGRVISATGDGSGYGNYVVIDHGGGYASLYAHLSSMSVGSGESVSQGQTVGACGATGNVTGDHLHFEIRVNGSPQDPMAYLP